MDKWNEIPPTTEIVTRKTVSVPLDQAIRDPRTVINPTVRIPIPPQPNELPATKVIKIRKE